MSAAGFVCLIGVYASFSLAQHAGRSEESSRQRWGFLAILSAGCTAWATHMIALLAFQPGMASGFDPLLTALSLVFVVAGIGVGIGLAIGTRDRRLRFFAGLVLGLSITLLHYVGQAGYRVAGTVSWDVGLAGGTVLASLVMNGIAMVVAGERNRSLRRFGAPMLFAAIAVLHLGGMTAIQLTFDPRIRLPDYTMAPNVIAPIVAGVCLGLMALAFLGLRFTLNARAQTRRDQARLRELANLAIEGLAICDGAVITAVNDSLQKLSGRTRDDLIGQDLGTLLPTTALQELGLREEGDAELIGANGQLVPVRVLRSEVTVGSAKQTVVAIRDQRERLKMEATFRRLAYTDTLTGLTNRLRFNELLARKANHPQRSQNPFALLALDLDRFKWINDTLGHSVGDLVLQQVAVRLEELVQPGDTIARLGGDEFMLLLPEEKDRARDIAERAVLSLRQPYAVQGLTIEIGVSVGIAYSQTDGDTGDELTSNADLALYRAKQSGRNRICKFEPQMLLDALARRTLEMDLRLALQRDEFVVHYQPQIDASTGAFQGAEALVRWQHPTKGLVSPADFIPLAEELGLIGTIGQKVLAVACREALSWPSEFTVAVNLSAHQLTEIDLVQKVAAVLSATGLPSSRLELEVTESALLQDTDRTHANLHGIHELGVRVSLDDFGTGYSSLSHLTQFPFDKLKIDQSFVRRLPGDNNSVAIVQAVVGLADKLKMTVTMEGVEREEQRAFAKREGCQGIQGYLVSRPIASHELGELFDPHRVSDHEWNRTTPVEAGLKR
ncbi:EAL domain-containing protein [Fulvimarina endophytica]|uniref:EAL domain-containing protein n=1 Tax=Fulvimarina endophytica TaxID=2293836 RepID=A0A371WXM6_9HYPH|nr:EAL domain-containing protein [Fulvimarina endophytica]